MNLLERLQASSRVTGARDREPVTVGPFTAFIDERRPQKWWSFALAAPGTGMEAATALPELAETFANRARIARVELIDELCPDLPGVFEAAGWVRSDHVPVMICTPSTFVRAPAPEGIELVVPGPDVSDALILEWERTQEIAFEDPEPNPPVDVTLWRERAAARFLACAVAGDRVLGTAECSGIVAGVAEVGGVATLPEHRGRGIAAFLTATVVQAAFAAGGEIAWLSAAAAAERIYGRAGFSVAGTYSVYEAPLAAEAPAR